MASLFILDVPIGTPSSSRLALTKNSFAILGSPKLKSGLTPENGKTKVVWATDSNFGGNPMKRVFGLMMDGFLGPTHERGLANLNRVASATR